jgi:hypothetical protein
MKIFVKWLLSQIGLLQFFLKFYVWLSPKWRRARRLKQINDKEFTDLIDLLFDRMNLNVIQVGSNDGFSNDPLQKYIINNKWNAVLIEPVPRIYARLVDRYAEIKNVKILNLAIHPAGSNNGRMKFYSVSESAKIMLGPSCPDWYDQLGSFNRSNIEGHLQGMLTPFIEEIDVLVASLEEVVR